MSTSEPGATAPSVGAVATVPGPGSPSSCFSRCAADGERLACGRTQHPPPRKRASLPGCRGSPSGWSARSRCAATTLTPRRRRTPVLAAARPGGSWRCWRCGRAGRGGRRDRRGALAGRSATAAVGERRHARQQIAGDARRRRDRGWAAGLRAGLRRSGSISMRPLSCSPTLREAARWRRRARRGARSICSGRAPCWSTSPTRRGWGRPAPKTSGCCGRPGSLSGRRRSARATYAAVTAAETAVAADRSTRRPVGCS